MDDILSQIIAYSPNKIDTEVKARSLVQGPRNMYAGGQLVRNTVDGSRPGYAGNVRKGPTATAINEIIKNQTVFENRADLKDKIKTKIGRDPGIMRPARYPSLKKVKYKDEMSATEARNAEKTRLENVRKERATKREQGLTTRQIKAAKKAENVILREKKEIAKIKAAEAKLPKNIGELDRPLTKGERIILNKSYNNIFLEEFDRLKNEGDLFSKTDLNRAVINRIADENPTIDIASGKGLDKVFNGDENHKSMHERTDGGKTSLITKKDMQNFTKNTNALGYTKNQDRLLQALLAGNTDFDDLAEELGFNEGRLKGNLNKLMRNLAFTDKSQQPLFFKKYSQEDLEKARNAVFDSPTLESVYQRTALQSILASTVEGSKQRKDALNKYKEFNKFKAVMKENGIDPKLVAMDHAASYRAIKNGNIKNFLAMTPIMSDINAVKSTFDRRSQLNLRRMQEAIANGDNVAYKKFLKNQTELEGIWKTMTGDQSSLGKIRIGATGKKKGVTKIFDYGATSILDKNKNLLNELGDNLVIRENIVKASTKGNLDEVSRIMFEGSEAEKPRPSKLPESFRNLNKPEMFKTENQIKTLLKDFEARGCGKAAGGRILFSNGGEAITTCAKKGVAGFIDDLKKGNYSKATMNILKGGGNVLKNILNPKELLKLRNYFGPVALGFMAAYEGGVITDDVVRQGTPLNESLANNWLTKSFLPYTKDYAQAKNLLETGNVPSNMKKYVQDVVTFNEALKDIQGIENRVSSRLVDQGGYGMIDGSSMYSQEQQDKEDAAVAKKLSGITDYNFLGGSAKDLEYKKMLDEMEATRMAKKEFSPIFGFDKLKDVRTPGSTSFDYLPDETPKDLRPITYMDAEYEDVKTLPFAERKMYEDYFTKKGILQPRQSLSELKFGDSNIYDEVLKDYNKFQRQKEASQYPGYYGTQEPDRFMEGGIASLNVKK